MRLCSSKRLSQKSTLLSSGGRDLHRSVDCTSAIAAPHGHSAVRRRTTSADDRYLSHELVARRSLAGCFWASWLLRSGGGESGARAQHPHRCSGFTLAELLVVVAIIGVIGGLGAGAFFTARRQYAIHGSVGEIQAILRAARNSAVATGNPTVVEVEPTSRKVSTRLFNPVGEWSFETGGERTRRGNLVVRRETSVNVEVAAGPVGDAIKIGSQGGHVDCGSEARFDLRTSLAIEAWVRHDLSPSPKFFTKAESKRSRRRLGARTRRETQGGKARHGRVIVQKKGAYGLSMRDDGTLVGMLGDVRVVTTAPVVPPGRWVHVALVFDGGKVTILGDRVPRGWRVEAPRKDSEPPALLPVVAEPLTISAREAPFPGVIDEVRLSGSVEPLVFVCPETQQLVGWRKSIHFDARGHLDAQFHEDPIRLTLVELPQGWTSETSTEATGTAVAMDFTVSFEVWRARWDDPPDDLSELGEEAKILAGFGAATQRTVTIGRLGYVEPEA